MAHGNQGQTMALKQNLKSSNHRALVAQRTTIDKHIRYNTRPGAQQPSVIGKAVVAIIAAVYLDCGSRNITWDIMQHIGLVLIVHTRNTMIVDDWQLFCST